MRSWLAENYERTESVWLVTYKKHTGDKYVPYDDIVEEALCFGWVDSLPRKLDDARTMLLLSPRRPKSPWSGLNKRRVEKLIAANLMTPAGYAKIEQAKQDGSWTVYDEIEALIVPPDLAEALNRMPDGHALWDARSNSDKKGLLWQIKSAKRPETRRKRIEKAVATISEGNVGCHKV